MGSSSEKGLSSRIGAFQGGGDGDGRDALPLKPISRADPPPELAVGGVFSADRRSQFFSDSEDEDDDDEPDEEEEEDREVDIRGENNRGKIHSERASLQENLSSGFSRDMVNGEQNQQDHPIHGYENALTVVEHDSFYEHNLHWGADRPEASRENGARSASGYWDSLRSCFSDPLTGVLMEDAMILSCGHSYSNSGMQHVYRMKACWKCSQPISQDSVHPNLALRTAIQSFLREQESHLLKASKRRRDCFEQDKCGYDDSFPTDLSRNKALQFPFAVSDRVLIRGNKRTPPRFVGRVAVITAQCLNGWYVVKTLDNAESVKLQYRSLAKVSDELDPSSAVPPNRSHNTNWL